MFNALREMGFPLFQWGFSIQRPRFLVPLLSNNILLSGNGVVASSPFLGSDVRPLVTPKPADAKLDLPSEPPSASSSASSSLSSSPSPSPSPSLASCSATPSPSHSSSSSSSASLESLSDEEILCMLENGQLPHRQLERRLPHQRVRALSLRRRFIARLQHVPESDLTFDAVIGADSSTAYQQLMQSIDGVCCENVIGLMPLPLGVAGPLRVDSQTHYVPLATTEGALVASISRGAKLISDAGGAVTAVLNDGMTRAPVVRFTSGGVQRAVQLQRWLQCAENFAAVAEKFQCGSRFAKLRSIKPCVAGNTVYLRFKATTGNAMGMNMLTKGVEQALLFLRSESLFPDMEILSLSGNYCADKKSAAVNWIDGRGKSVVAEVVLSAQLVQQILHTTVERLVELNTAKNLVGSALAGGAGGSQNAHAANVVAAVFLATGQDAAQVVSSSACLTSMSAMNDGRALYASVTMPSIECGTVGGGTQLAPQAAALRLLLATAEQQESISPANSSSNCAALPAAAVDSSERLARVIAATVLAGELSLMGSLAEGTLLKSHMALNRRHSTTTSSSSSASSASSSKPQMECFDKLL